MEFEVVPHTGVDQHSCFFNYTRFKCIAAIFHHPAFDKLSNETDWNPPITPYGITFLNLGLIYIEVTWNKQWDALVVIGSFQTARRKMMSKDECWMM